MNRARLEKLRVSQKICRPVNGRDARRFGPREQSDEGFTLIELIIVVLILPLVVGAISIALLSVFSLQTGVSSRLAASGDAQVVSAYFAKDIQSASLITLNNTNTFNCGPSNQQLIGLQWNAPGGTTTVVSYVVVPNGTTNNLVRLVCKATSGAAVTSTAVSSSVISQNVSNLSVLSPNISVKGNSCSSSGSCVSVTTLSPQNNWLATTGMSAVTLPITESTNTASYTKQGGFSYAFSAAPRDWYQSGTRYPSLLPVELLGTSGTNLSCNGAAGTFNVSGPIALNSSSPSASTLTHENLKTTSLIYTVYPYGSSTPVPGSATTATPLSAPITDPFSGLTAPSSAGLPIDPPPVTVNGTPTAQPGIYTTPLGAAGGTLVLASGTYILQDGMSVTGNISSAPGGVFLYVTGGQIAMQGGGSLNLSPLAATASPPPPAPGLVIWQTDSTQISLKGNPSGQLITGVLYAPTADVSISGKGTLSGQYILSQSLSCNGSATFNITG